MIAIFTSQIGPDCIRINLRGPKSQKFPGGACPQTPVRCRALFYRPLKLSLCCVLPPLVIFSKRNPDLMASLWRQFD